MPVTLSMIFCTMIFLRLFCESRALDTKSKKNASVHAVKQCYIFSESERFLRWWFGTFCVIYFDLQGWSVCGTCLCYCELALEHSLLVLSYVERCSAPRPQRLLLFFKCVLKYKVCTYFNIRSDEIGIYWKIQEGTYYYIILVHT